MFSGILNKLPCYLVVTYNIWSEWTTIYYIICLLQIYSSIMGGVLVSWWPRGIVSMMGECWADVTKGSPTFDQPRFNLLIVSTTMSMMRDDVVFVITPIINRSVYGLMILITGTNSHSKFKAFRRLPYLWIHTFHTGYLLASTAILDFWNLYRMYSHKYN